ncbi:MAG: hypothetical protein IJL14_09685 [Selenomonadaceae bacterium]|nr:hypothetical protein [Selenomonadaceae bacterium]
MRSTFNSILNRICNALFGDSWDKVLYFLERLDNALREKYSESGTLYFSLITLENSGGGMATVNHSHFYQENGEWLKENAKIDLPKDELPNYLRKKLSAAFGEVDITADVEHEISLRKSAE